MPCSQMTGPGGTVYKVHFESKRGRVGFANFNDGKARVRVEPANGISLKLPGWKQPSDGNRRFSRVTDESGLQKYLEEATALLTPPVYALPKVVANLPMVGPGGTSYAVVFHGSKGRVGFAQVGNNEFRVRVEPVNTISGLSGFGSSWLQPTESNPRFSFTTSAVTGLVKAVAEGVAALA